jgi:hypothetical protein
MQEPVNINPKTGESMKQGEQTPIDPILSSANLMVQSFAPPFAGTKSYAGLGCIDYENTKNAEPGTKRMWCKDTPRVGDAGTSSALLAVAAGPAFSSSPNIGYNPTAPLKQLFAGPVFAAFPTGECNPDDQPDGICDLAPTDSAQPLPTAVTMDLITQHKNANATCALTSCNINVGMGFEDPIPPVLKDILSAAGADWNVPAKVVLAFMVAEGYFSKVGSGATMGEWLKYDWTQSNILAWSLPVEGTIVKKGFMTPCDDLNWGEQGTPSMFISDWDSSYGSACASWNDSSLKCGIEKLVTGRGQYARRCNLLDSAYGLAKSAATAANPTSCNWDAGMYAAALGAFTGSDPMAKPGSPYYGLMESVIANCHNP